MKSYQSKRNFFCTPERNSFSKAHRRLLACGPDVVKHDSWGTTTCHQIVKNRYEVSNHDSYKSQIPTTKKHSATNIHFQTSKLLERGQRIFIPRGSCSKVEFFGFVQRQMSIFIKRFNQLLWLFHVKKTKILHVSDRYVFEPPSQICEVWVSCCFY